MRYPCLISKPDTDCNIIYCPLFWDRRDEIFYGLLKFLYICIARIRHASRKAAYQGGTFILYMIYTNIPLDTSGIIIQLKNRGLFISDESFASDFLEHVNYFRFAAYLRPMEIDKAHNYKTGAFFDNAVKLYRFDSELRQLVFSAIQRIEVSLRAKIINKFSLGHGAMWFLRPKLANDKHNFTDNLSNLERELKRSKEDFIKDHHGRYIAVL